MRALALLLLIAVSASAQYLPHTRKAFQPVVGGGGPADPTILWWKCNDGSGSTITADAGPNGSTDGSWSTGYITFNGTSQEASSSSSITPGVQVVTTMMWIKRSSWNSGGAEVLMELGSGGANGAFLLYEQGGYLNLNLSESGGTVRNEYIFVDAGVLPTSTWVHIAAVWDNSTSSGEIKLYFNGSVQSTSLVDAKSGTGNIRTDTFYLGARTASSLWCDGDYDDIRIYSGEVSSSDITTIYNAGRQ